MRASAVIALMALSACPAQQKKGPPPPPPPPEIETTEALAFEAEREINAAEQALGALQPDQAIDHLDKADGYLRQELFRSYPDAKVLAARHTELLGRVPSVREEIRKQKLAEAVQAAKTKIDGAASSLDAAMKAIERREPEDADLSAADQGIAAIENALEEAQKLESEDRPYGKYALDVRKRLAAQKKRARERQLEVAVQRSSAEIAKAIADLDGAIAQLQSKNVDKVEFDQAGSMVTELEKILTRGDELAGKDARFAKHMGAVRKRLVGQRERIAKRLHEVTVQRQREIVDTAGKELGAALGRLSAKDVVDADFAEAEKALAALEKALTDGKPLEPKDPRYFTYAGVIEKKIEDARKRIGDRRLAAAIEKQKLEIEAGRAALKEALARIEAADPAEGEIKAAQDGILAVEKTLEPASALTAKDKAFSAYVLDVRKSLQKARERVAVRELEIAVAKQKMLVKTAIDELAAAMKVIAVRGAQETDFGAADTAVASVETALASGEIYAVRDRGYSTFALGARKTAADARKRIKDRREQAAVEAQRDMVDVALDAVKKAVADLAGFSPTEEQFKAAEDGLSALGSALEKGIELEVKVGAYKAFAAGARKSLRAAEQRVDGRRTEIAVRERTMLVEDALAAFEGNLRGAKKSDASSDHVKEATASLQTVRDELAKGEPLELKDRGYQKVAASARTKLRVAEEDLSIAKHTAAFREGPAKDLADAQELRRSANGLDTPEKKKTFEAALEKLKSCQATGGAILSEAPKLAGVAFTAGQRRSKAKDLLAECGKAAEGVEKLVGEMEAVISFYDGPAKALVGGKTLLGEGDGTSEPAKKKQVYQAALKEFEVCLEKGKLLQHQHPKLAKERFDIDGKSVTLATVIAACQKGAETARDSMK
jgi:hypothetical protein